MTTRDTERIHDLPRLLNASEVAEILNIGISTVYQLIQRKELLCVRIGRTVRIRPIDLSTYIENRIDQTEEDPHANH